MATKNYVFGAYAPVLNADLVDEQMTAAHRYRNKLCELERKRRDTADQTIRRLSPEYAAIADQYAAYDGQIKQIKDDAKKKSQKAQKKVPITAEATSQLVSLKKLRKELSEALKKTKAAAYRLLKARQAPFREQAALTDVTGLKPTHAKRVIYAQYHQLAEAAGLDDGAWQHSQDVKEERGKCGCYWGTYNLIEDAAKAFHKGPPPNFKRFDGGGAVGVQIQGGKGKRRLTPDVAMTSKNQQLQLYIPNLEELHTTRSAGRAGRSRGLRSQGFAKLRIGSNDDDSPIWTQFPVRWHRALPTQCDIRYAVVHRSRIGTKNEWRLRLVLELPDEPRKISNPGSVVSVHLGWRRLEAGIRIATWQGSDGSRDEYVLSNELERAHEYPSSLQAIRDLVLNHKKIRWAAWYDANLASFPEWFLEETVAIKQWVSQARFAALCLKWREKMETMANVPRAARAYKHLEHWRKWDKHLLEWLSHQREKTLRHRNDDYRCLAKRLAMRYETVVLPNTDYSKLMKKAEVDEEETQSTLQRRQARFGSPGTLSQFLKEKFGSSYSVLVPAEDITQACHVCGKIEDFDRRSQWHTCSKCGVAWDQDVNAGENQMKRGLSLLMSPKNPATTAAKPTSRRNRRKEQQKQPAPSETTSE